MRLFVALNLPHDTRERIHAATAPLRRSALPLRWTGMGALHLTLKFLGEIEDGARDAVERAIAGAVTRSAPFELRLGGTGAFPSLARPRVVWVGAEATPELLRLHQTLERALEPLGFAPEVGPFRPHLTLGRVRRGARATELRGLAELLDGVRFEAQLQVREAELMRSHLAPEGSRYEVVRAFPLG